MVVGGDKIYTYIYLNNTSRESNEFFFFFVNGGIPSIPPRPVRFPCTRAPSVRPAYDRAIRTCTPRTQHRGARSRRGETRSRSAAAVMSIYLFYYYGFRVKISPVQKIYLRSDVPLTERIPLLNLFFFFFLTSRKS